MGEGADDGLVCPGWSRQMMAADKLVEHSGDDAALRLGRNRHRHASVAADDLRNGRTSSLQNSALTSACASHMILRQ
jgi:hypothetical protein